MLLLQATVGTGVPLGKFVPRVDGHLSVLFHATAGTGNLAAFVPFEEVVPRVNDHLSVLFQGTADTHLPVLKNLSPVSNLDNL